MKRKEKNSVPGGILTHDLWVRKPALLSTSLNTIQLQI